jgi:hypothetical protein
MSTLHKNGKKRYMKRQKNVHHKWKRMRMWISEKTHSINTFGKLPKVESKGCGQPSNRKMGILCVKKILSCPLSTNNEQIIRNMVTQRNVDCQ